MHDEFLDYWRSSDATFLVGMKSSLYWRFVMNCLKALVVDWVLLNSRSSSCEALFRLKISLKFLSWDKSLKSVWTFDNLYSSTFHISSGVSFLSVGWGWYFGILFSNMGLWLYILASKAGGWSACTYWCRLAESMKLLNTVGSLCTFVCCDGIYGSSSLV